MQDVLKPRVVHYRIAVTPGRESSAGNQDAADFRIERIDLEPVQCLRDRNEIHALCVEPASIGRSDAIGYTRVPIAL